MPVEVGLVALATYFATVGPADLAVVFAALTARADPAARRSMALRGVLIGGAILIFFALFGSAVLDILGVSLPALRTAGGILLLLIAIDMVFARQSGGISTTSEENAEAAGKQDISVFPLATPLIAGPGAIGATVLLIANAGGDRTAIGVVIAALIAILVLTYVLLLLATQVQR
ncbi:MAG TPA: MarC family protein, partial [Devosiaceae bacterium]|nr:MarC family protein [Devosiaceae bacterium]